jgi:hypothetical protein
MDDARRILDAQAASDRHVFVDMFGRFDPATEVLHTAIAEGRYGPLKTLAIELRTALLWEGYQIGLDSIAMDVLHSSLDTIVTALGRPESMTAMGVAKNATSAAAEVLLGYPGAVVRCGASALLPKPYGMRGGYLWLAQTITAVAGRAPYRCLYPVAVESSVDASATKLASRSATERGRVRVGSAARSLSWHTA